MSSSKAKKKRKKQRLRLKKKKFNLKELLKKLERDRLADLWRKLAASMAAFDNHSGTRGRPIWEDGLGLFCNKKAMKALKPYSQPFEATTNDLNRLQPRVGNSVKFSLHSEAPTARQPTEQPFQTRPTPIQKSQFSVTSVRAPEKITSNVRCGVQSDAILVNPTVPVAPDKFSCQSSPFFKTASAASIPVLPKTLQGWSDLATVTRSFTGVSFAADQPIGGWLSTSMRRQPLVMVPPTPAAQPSPTAEENAPTVALQHESGSLPSEQGLASQEEKKGNKKRGHARKKRRRRHTKKHFAPGSGDISNWPVERTGCMFVMEDVSDSGTSDYSGCTSDSSDYSEGSYSDVESDHDGNIVFSQAAQGEAPLHEQSEQAVAPQPFPVRDNQKECRILYVTLGGGSVDNLTQNVASLGEEVDAEATFKVGEISSVLSSLVPKRPGFCAVSARPNGV